MWKSRFQLRSSNGQNHSSGSQHPMKKSPAKFPISLHWGNPLTP